MIKFVKNGKFRRLSVTINRLVAGVLTPGDGFPITESILQGFGESDLISEESLTMMNDIDFDLRADAFKSFLVSKYSFLSAADFDNTASGIDTVLCVPEIISTGIIQITNQTDIILIFDSSGSMNTALAPLVTMRDTLLKNMLLPFYGNDEALYNSKVKIISDGTERTFRALNNYGFGFPNPTLVMVFQDEANSSYTGTSSILPKKGDFINDMFSLRNSLNSFDPDYYRGIIFQVVNLLGEGVQFKNLIQAVQNGTVDYALPHNLTDKSEVGYVYDVIANGTPQFYLDLIVNKMRELGYDI